MKQTLLMRLANYAKGPDYPMHMPGHKRNVDLLGHALPLPLDITEIEGFDDLGHASGILLEGMRRAARLYGSDRAFYLVNGSTGGLLAGMRACAPRGSRVLVARNCHKAVYHAVELCAFRPVYLTPPTDEAFGICASVSPEQVKRALAEYPDLRLAVLVSPTYEGVVSDVQGIAEVLHEKGVPLLVDAAHGAHLGLAKGFAPAPRGADVWVQSLHKTLPGLTQTGLLHVKSDLVSTDEVARQWSIFQTSSPSYVLMASIDDCLRRMEEEGLTLFTDYRARLGQFDRDIRSLRRLRVLRHGADMPENHPHITAFDPGKILISTRDTALTGRALYDRLRGEYRIQMEMAMGDLALAMTSLCDTQAGFDRLAEALIDIDRTCGPARERVAMPPLPEAPEVVLTLEEALTREICYCPLAESAGRIAAEYAWAYPPGIPIFAPGQRIDESSIHYMQALLQGGDPVRTTSGRFPGEIAVVLS